MGTPKPTPRQRLFTKEYKLGDHVSITREAHGWHEGARSGYIVEMSDDCGIVLDDEDTPITYEINHPRDIHPSGRVVHEKERRQVLAKYRSKK